MVELDGGWRETFGFNVFAAGVAALLERLRPLPGISTGAVDDPARADPASVALTTCGCSR
jgi:hypothetical protein